MQDLLASYQARFQRLRRGGTAQGPAPHKPVFLLTLIECFGQGNFAQNRIPLHAEWVALYRENALLLCDVHYQPDFARPFFHLKSEGFWEPFILGKQAMQKHIGSLQQLINLGAWAQLAPDLFHLLQNAEARSVLMQTLLETYFPTRAQAFWEAKRSGQGFVQSQTDFILQEGEGPSLELSTEEEELQYVRGGLFKKWVPKVYEYRCAMTQMKLIPLRGGQMVDACHIVPFSLSGDDRVVNGLALCPNLHRAFDRGWVSVDAQLKIMVAQDFMEDEEHPYSLHRLQGQSLNLPLTRKYWPDLECLRWHREHCFLG